MLQNLPFFTVTLGKLNFFSAKPLAIHILAPCCCCFFFVCMVGFLKSLSATRLYRGLILTILHAATHEIECGDHDFCLSLSPIQPVGSGYTQRESNPRQPHLELCALLTELPASQKSNESRRTINDLKPMLNPLKTAA